MAVDPDVLAAELRSLRKDRGAFHPALLTRLGPYTKALCQITDADGVSAGRRKLLIAIEGLLQGEPGEAPLLVLASLGLHEQADQRHPGERQEWLAKRLFCDKRTVRQIRCDERTARRRIDEASAQIVHAAEQHESAEIADTPGDIPSARRNDGWYVAAGRIWSLCRVRLIAVAKIFHVESCDVSAGASCVSLLKYATDLGHHWSR